MAHSGEATGYSFIERRHPGHGNGARIRRIGWRELGRRLAAGEVLWDLRPIHEHLRFRLDGAVNLGDLDWLRADADARRLLEATVIARVLARCGIVRGTAVILQPGEHRDTIDLAVRALNAIGIHRVTCLDSGRRVDDPALRAAATHPRLH